jgi:hypothetical protein
MKVVPHVINALRRATEATMPFEDVLGDIKEHVPGTENMPPADLIQRVRQGLNLAIRYEWAENVDRRYRITKAGEALDFTKAFN